jgi:glycosyltransferase involved in cell wall biosynthesis
MKITAMVLVGKNEPYLEYCIDSIKDIVDEIVCVYSADRLYFGGMEKIKFVCAPEGRTDFSEWRNLALKEAKGDWILYIDADEILAKPDGSPIHRKELEMLMEYADKSKVSGFHIRTLHFLYNYKMIDGSDNGNHYSICRFYRKKDVKKYEGKIHELPVLPEGSVIKPLNTMFIWHFGHCKGMEDLREKYRRSMSIEGNPFKPNFERFDNADQYCAQHELFHMRRPIIFYNGPLPKVMKLW